jgi:hypothetical protein
MQASLQQLQGELEAERAARGARDAEKAALEARLTRLHDIVLNSTRALVATPPAVAAGAHAASTGSLSARGSGVLTTAADSLPPRRTISGSGNASGAAPLWQPPAVGHAQMSSGGSFVAMPPVASASGAAVQTRGVPPLWSARSGSASGRGRAQGPESGASEARAAVVSQLGSPWAGSWGQWSPAQRATPRRRDSVRVVLLSSTSAQSQSQQVNPAARVHDACLLQFCKRSGTVCGS